MKALVTGASSGIGKEIAKLLAGEGYDLVIVARSVDKLNNLKEEIEKANAKVTVEVVQMDLSNVENCSKLYALYKEKISFW